MSKWRCQSFRGDLKQQQQQPWRWRGNETQRTIKKWTQHAPIDITPMRNWHFLPFHFQLHPPYYFPLLHVSLSLSLLPLLILLLSLFLGKVLALLLNESDISWSKGSRPQVELGNLEFPTHASIVCHIIYGVASYIVNYYELWVLLGCCDRSVLCSASGNLTPFDQLTELPCCTTFNCFHTRST